MGEETNDARVSTTLSDFLQMLRRHDWTYEMSDDPGMYRRGRESETTIGLVRKESEKHEELYVAYIAWRQGGCIGMMPSVISDASGEKVVVFTKVKQPPKKTTRRAKVFVAKRRKSRTFGGKRRVAAKVPRRKK